MKKHKDGTLPPFGEKFILVFGSNLSGRHGKGAAKEALRYGAQYGIASGLQGSSYAIPTKDGELHTLPVAVIAKFVKEFIDFTRQSPKKNFWITRVGAGLAGYSDEDIAPMFKGIGDNCSVSEQWYNILENL